MIFYFAKQTKHYYDILNEGGIKVGSLSRRDGRNYWKYDSIDGRGFTLPLSKDLIKSLKKLQPNARWFEQLTLFEEVK